MKTINFKKMIYVLFILSTILTSCEKENNKTEILGSWQIQYIKDKTNDEEVIYPDSLDKHETIILTDSSYAVLQGNCNYGGATFKMNNDQISFSNIHISELPCQKGWEFIFYELLQAEYYNMKDNKLEIRTSGEYDLIFERK